jgi:flagellar basal-body rod protein FlgC
MTAITAAVSGLQASIAELDASAENLANAQSDGPLAGSGWGPATVVGSSGASGGAPQAYQPVTAVDTTGSDASVSVSYAPVTPATEPAYDPTSPFADANGLVARPNVDPATEIVGQTSSLLSFKANLASLKVAEEMQQSLLAIA